MASGPIDPPPLSSNVPESSGKQTERDAVGEEKKLVPINHPGIIALVAYMLFVFVVCLWLLGTLLMALPPPDDSSTNGNANIESGTNNRNADNQNRNGNSNIGNSNISSSVSARNSNARDNIPRFVAAAYLPQGGPEPNRTGNVSNKNATPSSTGASNINAASKTNPSTERDRENRIQGIPRRVTVTFHSPFFSPRTYIFSGEAYLFLIVIVSGALGVIARAIFSIFRHIGLGDFSFRWTWYYILSPSGGIALSVVFYVVVRGGFYNPATISGDLPLNPFSFAALGALAGLFSENAMLKLKKIAEVLFMPVEEKNNRPRNQ